MTRLRSFRTALTHQVLVAMGVILACPIATLSQNWSPVPEAQSVPFIDVETGPDGDFWIASTDTGLFRFDRETNELRSVTAPPGRIRSMLVDSDVILAVTTQDGESPERQLHRSLDGGTTWIKVLTYRGSEPTRLLRDTDGRRYLATSFGGLLSELAGSNGGKWQLYKRFDHVSRDSLTEVLSIAGRSGALVVSLVDFTFSKGGTTNDIMLEESPGQWKSISPSTESVADWTVARTSTGRLIVSTAVDTKKTPIYTSVDNGASWREIEGRATTHYFKGRQTHAASTSGSVVYGRDQQALYSTDGGETYETIYVGGTIVWCYVGFDDRIRFVVFDSRQSAALYEENAARSGFDRVLSAPIYPVRDFFNLDRPVTGIIPPSRHRHAPWYSVVAGTELWELANGASDWARVPDFPVDTLRTGVEYGHGILIGGEQGLFYRSDTGDRGWQSIDTGTPVDGLALGDAGIILIDPGDAPMSYLNSGTGERLQPAPESPVSDRTSSIVGIGPDRNLYVINDLGLYRLPKLTDRWDYYPTPVETETLISAHINYQGFVALATNQEIWASDDSGTTWFRRPFPDAPALEFDLGWGHEVGWKQSRHTRFVVRTADDLWHSIDTGRSWTSTRGNLPTSGRVTAFRFEFDGWGSIAAVQGRGLFRMGASVVSDVDESRQRDSDRDLVEVFVRDDVVRIIGPASILVDEIVAVNVRGMEVGGEVVVRSRRGNSVELEWYRQTADRFLLLRIPYENESAVAKIQFSNQSR